MGVYTQYKKDGTLDRNKARLDAEEFTQTYGVDYSETSFQLQNWIPLVLLSVVVNKDWPLYQLDVKNALLNEDLEESLYEPPSRIWSPVWSYGSANLEILV